MSVFLVPITTTQLNPVEREWLEMANAYRRSLSLAPVEVTGALQLIGSWKSRDQALHPELPLSHTDSLGRSAQARWDIGYDLNTWKGEIVLFGSNVGARQALDLWLASPGHRGVIEGRDYRFAGVCRFQVLDLSYWTVEFGGERCDSPTG